MRGEESEEFNKQLILTGSYAGKTTGSLMKWRSRSPEMARHAARRGRSTDPVVGSGAFTGRAMKMVSPYRGQNAGKRYRAVGG